MAGTKEGGLKSKESNIFYNGPDFYKKIGALGGKKKVPKGFAMMTPEQRSAAGKKGGTISRRTK